MTNFINNLYKNQALFYKVFLFIITAVVIVYLLPKGGKFKYEITKGKPWQYENLYAPFDFAILKTDDEIVKERDQIIANNIPYYTFNQKVVEQVYQKVEQEINEVFSDSILQRRGRNISPFVENILEDIYEYGVLEEDRRTNPDQLVYLKKGNEAYEVNYGKIFSQEEIRNYLTNAISKSNLNSLEPELLELFYNVIEPNVNFDASFTQKELDSKLSNISYTRGSIERGTIIISKGEVVEGEKLDILNSLRQEFETQVWSDASYNWILFC
jgi:membrane-associated HD superfamily phosphohydrolase